VGSIKSIIQDEKRCYICGQAYWLEDHHIFGGRANRKLSEKYGLKVWLCREHHRGDTGVHKNAELSDNLKEIAQKTFEETYKFEDLPPKITMTLKREDMRSVFIKMFGKSYIK
jgi:hypothetical protein